jgi:hypothetical protein
MEQGTPRQLPKNDWEIAMSVLEEKKMPLEQFVYPERHKSQATAALRAKVIYLMHKRGISKAVLTTIGPYTMRHIDRILANGSGSIDRELPFEDNLLSLRDEKEAVPESNPTPQKTQI